MFMNLTLYSCIEQLIFLLSIFFSPKISKRIFLEEEEQEQEQEQEQEEEEVCLDYI